MGHTKKVGLQKKVLSTKYANSLFQKKFNQFHQSGEYITNENSNEKVLEYYNELFYNIPKQGVQSHRKIVELEHEFLDAEWNANLDNQIDQLISQSAAKAEELAHLQNPIINEHPMYENGSFVTSGSDGMPFDFFQGISYVMQEGKKRKIVHSSQDGHLYQTIRKGLGLPQIEQSGFYFISIDELNDIKDGPDIDTFTDLNLKDFDPATDWDPNDLSEAITDYYPYHEITLYCYGVEQGDIILNNPSTDGTVTEAQLTSNPCEVTYLYNVLDFAGSPTVITEQIPKGHFKTIQFIRETIGNPELWPENYDALVRQYNDFEGLSLGGGLYYNRNTIDNYVKKWGKNKKYSGVLNAVGRLKSQEIHPTPESGPILFNGLPVAGTGAWTIIEPLGDDWETTEAFLDNYGNPVHSLTTVTAYGTPLIHAPGSGMWGGLNQDAALQEKFDDPNFEYYRKSILVGENGQTLNFNPTTLSADLGGVDSLNWIAFDSQGNFGGYRTSAFINYQNGQFKLYNDGNGKEFQIYGQPIYQFDDSHFVLCDIIDFRFTYGNTNQFFNAWEAYFVGSAAYNYIFGDLQWLIGQDISDGYGANFNSSGMGWSATGGEYMFDAMATITDELLITNLLLTDGIINSAGFFGSIDAQLLNQIIVEQFQMPNAANVQYENMYTTENNQTVLDPTYGYSITNAYFNQNGNTLPSGFFQSLLDGNFDNVIPTAADAPVPISQQFLEVGFGIPYENIGYPMSLFHLNQKTGTFILFYDLNSKEFVIKSDIEMTPKLTNNYFNGNYANIDKSVVSYKSAGEINDSVLPIAFPWAINYSSIKPSAVGFVGLQGYGQACYALNDNSELGPFYTAYNGHPNNTLAGGTVSFQNQLFLSTYRVFPMVSMFINGYLKNTSNGYAFSNYFNPNVGGVNGVSLGGSNVLYNPDQYGGVVNSLGYNNAVTQWIDENTDTGGLTPGVNSGIDSSGAWSGIRYPEIEP